MLALITDFGEDSVYPARIKARVLASKNTPILDITHSINANDINEASYVYHLVADSLETGTVILFGVDSDQRYKHAEVIACKYNGHILMSYNSGLLSLIAGSDADFRVICSSKSRHAIAFSTDVSEQLSQIIDTGDIDQHPTIVDKLYIKKPLTPVIQSDRLTGTVIYVDSKKISHTNISRADFDLFVNGGFFNISLSRHERISRLSEAIEKYEGGMTSCFFNSAGYLAVEVYRDSAEGMYGLNRGQTISIERK